MLRAFLLPTIAMGVVILVAHWGGGQVAVGWLALGMTTGFLCGISAMRTALLSGMNEKENS